MDWSRTLVTKQGPTFEEPLETDARMITHAAALREGLDQALERDEGVFVMGQGVTDPSAMFGVTRDLEGKYGKKRGLSYDHVGPTKPVRYGVQAPLTSRCCATRGLSCHSTQTRETSQLHLASTGLSSRRSLSLSGRI